MVGGVKFLVLLLIWRAVWRFGLLLWRIPTFGPVIVGVIVLAVAAAGVMRAARLGPWRRRGGIFGGGSGSGPRDW
jgi:hypothetical protein